MKMLILVLGIRLIWLRLQCEKVNFFVMHYLPLAFVYIDGPKRKEKQGTQEFNPLEFSQSTSYLLASKRFDRWISPARKGFLLRSRNCFGCAAPPCAPPQYLCATAACE